MEVLIVMVPFYLAMYLIFVHDWSDDDDKKNKRRK